MTERHLSPRVSSVYLRFPLRTAEREGEPLTPQCGG